GGAGLGGEARLALVDIGDGQRPAGRQDRKSDVEGNGDRVGGDAAEQRGVVGAVDGDGDELAGGAVGGHRGEAVGDALAGAELLDRGLAVGGGVGPVARRIEGEAAVAVAAGGAGLGGEARLALVDIGDGQRPAGRQVAGNHPDIPGDRVGDDAAEHRGVVGAVDGDGDELAGGAVGGHRGEAVGDALAGAELLDRGLAVGGGVGPVARGVEGEAAVAVAAGGAGLGGEGGLALVDIGDGQCPAGRQVAGHHADILGDRAGDDPAEYRHVVGAVDGDGDYLSGGAVRGHRGSVPTRRSSDLELLDRGLAVGGGVGPVARGVEGEAAVAVAAGGVEIGRASCREMVDICDGHCSAGRQVAGDLDVYHVDRYGD